jgi:membrane protease subunit HflC
MRGFGWLILIVLLGGGFVLSQSVYTVHEREQALILRLGEPVGVVNTPGTNGAGLHFKMPFVISIQKYPKYLLALEMEATEFLPSDQERIEVDAFLRYRITDPIRFYQALVDENGAGVVLSSIMDNSLRGVIGSISRSDVISGQRAELMTSVQSTVDRQVAAQNLGIEVVDVRIKRAELPDEVRLSVVSRMEAERGQEAERIRAEGEERFREIRAEAERDQRILLAEAQAESERIQGAGDARRNAIYANAYGRDMEFFAFYRSMLAYEEAVQGGTPIVIPPDSEFFRYFRSETGE